MKIAIMGFGTVGFGAYQVAKSIENIEVVRIFSRKLRKEYEPTLVKDGRLGIFTMNPEDIWNNAGIDLVIESMGGIYPAKEYVLNCLYAGKHVVTPNKNLISAFYNELHSVAEDKGVQLRYTAAVGGGIPWLNNLKRTTRCDSVEEVRGIVNGTCNYILDSMHENGEDYIDVLKKAQELGYAESNPTADVDGFDTQRKAVISANLAYNTIIREEDVPCHGISFIDKTDIDWFNKHGYKCKLIMCSKKLENSRLVAYVEPQLFPISSLEANVKSNNNMITLVGENIGTQSFYGQGAGMYPTGTSVMQDVIDVMEGIPSPSVRNCIRVVDNSSELHRYYIRTGEKVGVTKPVSVEEMHKTADKCIAEGRSIFFAAFTD